MKQHSGPIGRLVALRHLVHRFAFIGMVGVAFGLMLLGKADTLLVERTRVFITDTVAPILDVMARPAAVIAGVVDNVRELAALRAENARLAEDNGRLVHWQSVARQLEAENRALRTQLNFIPDPDPAYLTARVVADTGGAFVHSLLIAAGSRDGVRKGQAVMSGEVLVGRIAEVGLRSSRIVLVTDLNSRIPVLVESSRAKAILTGDNSDRPKLNYITSSVPVVPGDHIVTSGHGGGFPPGMPIGVVTSVAEGMVRVEPFVHRHQLEFVTVVDFGLAGILSNIGGKDEEGKRR
ncbi:MAG: rod shape-determining protein MreC [Rhodospirillales bacterium]|nr:rod shape-determining protein MreC [Rhodospirillales bacterium]